MSLLQDITSKLGGVTTYFHYAVPLLVLITSYLLTVPMTRRTLPMLREKRICLLIAHPDDEAMFFAPTVLALSAPEAGNHVKILCLSSGNADGLGEVRKKELVRSGMILGLKHQDDVFVLEDDKLQDGMDVVWDADHVSRLLAEAFAKPSRIRAQKEAYGAATIDILITFDKHGVSGHSNHKSLYHGAHAFVAGLSRKTGSAARVPVDLYTLTSINIVRKYSSMLDSATSLCIAFLMQRRTARSKPRTRPGALLFFNGWGEFRRSQHAMTLAHQSQMRWFRWFWILASRYMVINDLTLEIFKA